MSGNNFTLETHFNVVVVVFIICLIGSVAFHDCGKEGVGRDHRGKAGGKVKE